MLEQNYMMKNKNTQRTDDRSRRQAIGRGIKLEDIAMVGGSES